MAALSHNPRPDRFVPEAGPALRSLWQKGKQWHGVRNTKVVTPRQILAQADRETDSDIAVALRLWANGAHDISTTGRYMATKVDPYWVVIDLDMKSNPLFGFGKKRKARPVARTGKRSSMTISQASSAAYQAGARIGDTGAFDSWLEKEGLAGRGKVLRKRLEDQFRKGVEEGETAPAETRTGEREHKGIQIWKSGGAWHTSIEPESEFDSEKDAKRFVDAQRKNPRRRFMDEFMEEKIRLGGLVVTRALAAHIMRDIAESHTELDKKQKYRMVDMYVMGPQAKALPEDTPLDASSVAEWNRITGEDIAEANPDGAALLLTPGPGLLEEEIMLAGSLFGGKKKKRNQDGTILLSQIKIGDRIYTGAGLGGGEVRRVTATRVQLVVKTGGWGKPFGEWWDKSELVGGTLTRDESDGSRTYRIVRTNTAELEQNPAGTSRLPVHLSRILSSNGGGRKIRAWKVESIPGPLGWITLQGIYATRGQAERKTLDVVRTALRDWDGRVELQFREVGHG